MSDHKDAAYRTIEGTARTAWRGVSPFLPAAFNHVGSDAHAGESAPLRGRPERRQGVPVAHRSRPHLVHTAAGAVYLIEGLRRRPIADPGTRATSRTLPDSGTVVTESELDDLANGSTAVVSVVSRARRPDRERAPASATIVVGGIAVRGIDGRGRRLKRAHRRLPGGRGADPTPRFGALDPSLSRRQRGTTHFLLPAGRDGGCAISGTWPTTSPDGPRLWRPARRARSGGSRRRRPRVRRKCSASVSTRPARRRSTLHLPNWACAATTGVTARRPRGARGVNAKVNGSCTTRASNTTPTATSRRSRCGSTSPTCSIPVRGSC